MSDLARRVANIERRTFGFTYEEAAPLYDKMESIRMSLSGDLKEAYYDANKELFSKLERVVLLPE